MDDWPRERKGADILVVVVFFLTSEDLGRMFDH